MHFRETKNVLMRWMAPVAALALVIGAAPQVALAQTGPHNLVLDFDMLAPLDEDAEGHYEGWAIVMGMPISTGKFNVNEMGEPVELGGGAVIAEFDAGTDITDATTIVISLEPPGDDDDVPAAIKPMVGDVVDAEAALYANIPDRQMLESFTTGSYILATPSDNPEVPDNDDMGIWYLMIEDGEPVPSLLQLPDIGPNWTYEGWVVDASDPGNPMPYSTGTFAMATGVDSDEAGCIGGGPPFPGQDFVEAQCEPYLDLDTGDYLAVISIEPVPDNRAAPFQFKPLAGAIPTDALGQDNEIANQAAETFPTGVALLYSEPVPANEVSWGEIKSSFNR